MEWKDALDAAMDGVAIFDAELDLVYANNAFCSLHECDDMEALAGRLEGASVWESLYAEAERARIDDEVMPLVMRAGSWSGRVRARSLAGGEFVAAITVARTRTGGVVSVLRDVTGDELRRRALEEREELYALVAHNATDLISLHDLDGRFVYASPSALRLLGCEAEGLIGTFPWEAIHADDVEAVRAGLRTAAAGRTGRFSYRVRVRSGDWVWFETLLRPVRSEGVDGEVDQLQGSTRDISERKRLEDQLAHQVLHDPLTGLPNRSLFLERLQGAPARSRRAERPFAVAYMDLDGFKQVNDSLGHAAGDALLKGVAERLQSVVRDTDTVARLSGDEFAVLLEHLADAADVRIFVHRALEALESEHRIGDTGVRVLPSIGIAVDETNEQEPGRLLQLADQAMYLAKRDPANAFVVHDGAGLDIGALGEDLAASLDADELTLSYQPLVSLADGAVVAVEALLRWEHPRLGRVSPYETFAIAREHGLRGRLTRWIMSTACRTAATWEGTGAHPPPRLCLNLGADEVRDPELLTILDAALEEAGLPAERMQVEIQPSVLTSHGSVVDGLKALGVLVALDGFGIDPVPIPLLARSAVDILKIAQPLVGSLDDPHGIAAAQAVLGLGSKLGLEVSAEGIETAAQMERLRTIGCLTIQGYYVTPPMPAAEIQRFLGSP